MKKSLKVIIQKVEEKIEKNKIESNLAEEVFTQIQFFQHERLIHLIVTFMTGISSILFLLGFLIIETIPLLLLFILTLILFIPYIFHYYTLENGTQRLYELYFEIKHKNEKTTFKL